MQNHHTQLVSKQRKEKRCTKDKLSCVLHCESLSNARLIDSEVYLLSLAALGRMLSLLLLCFRNCIRLSGPDLRQVGPRASLNLGFNL